MNNDRGLLSGSITILIGAVIAIMALVRGPWQVWLLLGVFTLWGLWVVLILLLPYMQQAKRHRQRQQRTRQLHAEGIQTRSFAYTSILTMKATVSGVKNVVLLIGGVIGAVFALVGLINFINLVMTNIITRRHEFATMQSIGMTNQQLRKMMISESFSYVLLAGIVGTLAAGVLGMTLVRAFVDISPSSIMMTFQMTLLPALIMLVLFLVLAFIVPVIALRLFNNRSVVERLRVNE